MYIHLKFELATPRVQLRNTVSITRALIRLPGRWYALVGPGGTRWGLVVNGCFRDGGAPLAFPILFENHALRVDLWLTL